MINYKAIKYVLICVISFTFLGCATAGNDSLRLESEASINNKIQIGVTTKAEIKSLFGSPMTTSYTDGGSEIWKYELSKMSADPTSYIPVVGLLAGSSSGVKKELVLLFNENDTVRKFNMSESDVKVRTGMFNQ
tara:strand:+ start:97 stop:498 length:402 start_codon:yes stop_codon:yes gene_type:complete